MRSVYIQDRKKLIVIILFICLSKIFGQANVCFKYLNNPYTNKAIKLENLSETKTIITDRKGCILVQNIDGNERFHIIFDTINSSSEFFTLKNKKDTIFDLSSLQTLLEPVIITQKTSTTGDYFSNVFLTIKDGEKIAATFDDPSRMITTTASTSQSSGNELTNYLIVRGNNPQGIQWRVNGIEVPSLSHFSQFGGTTGGISIFQSSALESVGLQTGNFSVDVGNATAGVFDLNLKKKTSDSLKNKITIGALGINYNTNGYFNKKRKIYFNSNVRYATLDLFNKLGVSFENRPLPSYYDGNFNLNINSKYFEECVFWSLYGKSKTSTDDINSTYNIFTVGNSLTKKINNDSKLQLNYILSTFKNSDLYNSNNYNLNYGEIIGRLKINYFLKLRNNFSLNSGIIYSVRKFNYNYNIRFKLQQYDNSQTIEQYIELVQKKERYQIFYGFHNTFFSLINKISFDPRIKFEIYPSTKLKINVALGKHSRLETLPAYYNVSFDYSNLNAKKLVSQKIENANYSSSIHLSSGLNYQINRKSNIKLEIYYQSNKNIPQMNNDSISYINYLRPIDEIGRSQFNGISRSKGVELYYENKSDKFILQLSSSILDARYLVKNKWESTRFNIGFVNSAIFGKEFNIKKKNKISFNYRITYNGGLYSVTPKPSNSPIEEQQKLIYNNFFSYKMPNYFRNDLQISYKLKKKKFDVIYKLDVLNLLNRKSAIEYYNSVTSSIPKKFYYLNITPVLSVSFEF